jgi:hypothetical protein
MQIDVMKYVICFDGWASSPTGILLYDDTHLFSAGVLQNMERNVLIHNQLISRHSSKFRWSAVESDRYR